MREVLRGARAFLFAAEEDFGIAPVEAQACGIPVIAFGKGGVLETVRDSSSGDETTGVFYDRHSPDAIADAVQRFETIAMRPDACRSNAERFSAERFRREFAATVEREWSRFAGGAASVRS